jgi:hypothetical protein
LLYGIHFMTEWMKRLILEFQKQKFLFLLIASFIFLSIGFNEAYAAVPQFDTYVADDPDNGDTVLSDGDTVTITFNIATNATGNGLITQGEIDANFTDGVGPPDFGTAYSGVWSADSKSLTITITDATGGTIAIGVDTIGGRGTTTIADADGGNADLISVGGDTALLSGDFGVIAAGGSGSVPDGGYQPPTMGVTRQGMLLVEDGFSYNNNPVDAHLMNTPYPMVTTNVGEENVAKLKIYSPRGIDRLQHVAVAFGLDKHQIFGESKVVLEWDKLPNGEETLTVIDPENYLDNVKAVTSEGKCRTNGNDQCFIIEFYHTFRQPLEYNIIGTYIWDDKRSGWQNYYNDGVEILGDSLNPPAKHKVSHKGKMIQITESGKNVALDQEGNSWTFDKEWKMDYVPQAKMDDGMTSQGIDRNNVKFSAYKQGQELIAEYALKTSPDGSLIQSKTLVEALSYDSDFISRSDNVMLQKLIENERNRADQMFSDNFVVDANDEFNKYLKIRQQYLEQISKN